MNKPQRLVTLLALAATMLSASAVAKAALDPGNQRQGPAKYLQLTSKVGGCQGFGTGRRPWRCRRERRLRGIIGARTENAARLYSRCRSYGGARSSLAPPSHPRLRYVISQGEAD
jgi:hypothetical protein